LFLDGSTNVDKRTKQTLGILSINVNVRRISHATIVVSRLIIAGRTGFGIENGNQGKIQKGKGKRDTAVRLETDELSVLVSFQPRIHIVVRHHQVIETG
jgi:hypothetical protein